MQSETDRAERVRIFAAWSRRLYESGGALIRVAHQARGEPEVATLHSEGDRRRRVALAEALNDPPAEVVDRAYVLTSPAVYLLCVDDCGWSAEQYQRWLERLLVSEL